MDPNKDGAGRGQSSALISNAFGGLCHELGFFDPKYLEGLRDLCILKPGEFIRNEGARLRGVAFIEDAGTGKRTWAPWTRSVYER